MVKLEQVICKTAVGDFEVMIYDNYIITGTFCNRTELKKDKYIKKALGEYQIVPGVSETSKKAEREITDYFAGKLQKFSLQYKLFGTDFQKLAWGELQKIPYGTTITYKTLANMCGVKNGFRAVGGANNKNPIAVLIPCHRVVGSNNSLTGYAGGIYLKEYLLNLEKTIYKAVSPTSNYTKY